MWPEGGLAPLGSGHGYNGYARMAGALRGGFCEAQQPYLGFPADVYVMYILMQCLSSSQNHVHVSSFKILHAALDLFRHGLSRRSSRQLDWSRTGDLGRCVGRLGSWLLD